MSSIQSSMTFFGLDCESFSSRYYRDLQRATKSDSFKAELNPEDTRWLKRCVVLALRHMSLTDHLESYGFVQSLLKPDLWQHMEQEDLSVLLSSLRVLRQANGADLTPIVDRLEPIVHKMTKDEETTISKFQQEVYTTMESLKGTRMIYNC